MFHAIDPYFWYRGCHPRAVVDIPWAHARLSIKDYRRFVSEYEGNKRAEKRCGQLDELNHFNLQQWREVVEAGPFEILRWEEKHSELCEEILANYPDIRESVMEGVAGRDLTIDRIIVVLRNKK